MPNVKRILLLAACAVAVAMPASAQGNSGNKPAQARARAERPQAKVNTSRQATPVRVIFRDRDREVFQGYHERHLVVVRPLPPGIEQRLERGKPLPPGIARTRLAPGLVRVAPRLPRGYSYLQVGPSVVVVDSRNRVVDILADVFR